MQITFLDIKTIQDPSLGSLSFFEATRDIPFEIKRVYYTYQVPNGAQRGGHAHKNLTQLLFCSYGKIKVILDDGVNKEDVMLDVPSKGLIISNGIWHDLIWKQENSVLCVATSEYYNKNDYIRDYGEFKKMVKEGYWNG